MTGKENQQKECEDEIISGLESTFGDLFRTNNLPQDVETLLQAYVGNSLVANNASEFLDQGLLSRDEVSQYVKTHNDARDRLLKIIEKKG